MNIMKKNISAKKSAKLSELRPFLKKHKFFDFFISTFLIVILIDQFTKLLAHTFLSSKIEVIPGMLWLSLLQNTGAAFGILSGNKLLLGVINLIVVVGIFLIVYKKKYENVLPLALIAGGAFSNSIDRFFYVGVIDFLNLGWWPVFNIADSCIVIGVVILIIFEVLDVFKKK